MLDKTRPLQFCILVVALATAAYFPSLKGDFLWDDAIFVDNPHVKSISGLREIWMGGDLPDFFPVTYSAFWVERQFFGLNPVGYNIVNLMLHITGTLLLWRVLLKLKFSAAKLIALAFAVHPICVCSVAWVSEQKNTLSLIFFLLSLISYLRFEGKKDFKWYVWALLAFAAALLSKTSVVVLPFVLLLIAAWQRGRVTGTDLKRSVPFFLLAAVFGAVTVCLQAQRFSGPSAYSSDPLGERLLLGSWSLWFYLSKALVPLGLNFVYPHWNVNVHNPYAYLPAVSWLAIFVILWTKRRTWGKPILFGLSYFTIALMPVLGAFQMTYSIYSQVADRFQYLAVIGVICLVCSGLQRAATNNFRARAVQLFPNVLILLSFALTLHRASLFADTEALWQATLKKNPGAWIAHKNLGDIAITHGRLDQAEAQYQRALRINPDDPFALNSYGNVLNALGRCDAAEGFYLRALALKPDYAKAHYNLGLNYRRKGATNDALVQFTMAIECDPKYAEAHSDAGTICFYRGELDAALGFFAEAAKLQPESSKAQYNLGVVLTLLGDTNQAIGCFRKALQLDPTSRQAQKELELLADRAQP